MTDVYHCADPSQSRRQCAVNPRAIAPPLLALGEEVVAAIPRPAALGVLGAYGAFLPVGHHGDSIRGDAHGHQITHSRLGTALAEGQVVLVGAALVAVAVDPHELVRIRLEPVRVG